MSTPSLRANVATWGAIALLLSSEAHAFEVATHAALSREAFVRSSLHATDPQVSALLRALGIEDFRNDTGDLYVNIEYRGESIRSARPKESYPEFTDKIFDRANQQSDFRPTIPSVAGWLMLGAVREDDFTLDTDEDLNNPQDDPEQAFDRVLFHFFDPVHDSPLKGITTYYKAPDWALAPDTGSMVLRQNRFSVPKAREAMWRALTLKRNDGIADLPLAPGKRIATTEAMRRAYWATTFRSLGDVLHLLQDMAQPQHTRDDAHAGIACLGGSCAAGHSSYFEKYVDARVTGRPMIRLRDRLMYRVPAPPDDLPVFPVALDYGGYPGSPTAYPLPQFRTYRDFFATQVLNLSTAGRGLANYSNQGFYTFGTNIGSTGAARYPSPSPGGVGLTRSIIWPGNAVDAAGQPIQDAVVLLRGQVVDMVSPVTLSEGNVALSTVGYFDEFMRVKGKVHYSLNHYNYTDQARLLIPRAVAYSAGLIDFFFRGRLEFAPQTDGGLYALADHTLQSCKDTCGFDKVRLKVRNATPDDTLGPGMLVSVAKFRRNTCYTSDLSGQPGGAQFRGYGCRGNEEEIVVSTPEFIPGLDKTAWTAVDFRFPKRIPVNASDVQLQVVFRGKLGTEDDAVVVETHDIGEPTFIGFANVSDYYYAASRMAYEPLGADASIDQLNLRLRVGGDTTPVVAQIARIRAQEHAQLAYLAEKGPVRITREFAVSAGTAFSPDHMNLQAAEFISFPIGQSYQTNLPVALHRGILRQAYSFLYAPGDTIYSCDVHAEFCSQATLPPLLPSAAKAFQVLF